MDPSQVRAAFLYVRSGELVVHDALPGLAELETLLRGPRESEPLTLL